MFSNIISTLNENTDNSRPRASSNPQQPNLIYNAKRYSPKTTKRGPTTSSALSTKPNRSSARREKISLSLIIKI